MWFDAKTTAPKVYLVKPALGSLKPLERLTIEIYTTMQV